MKDPHTVSLIHQQKLMDLNTMRRALFPFCKQNGTLGVSPRRWIASKPSIGFRFTSLQDVPCCRYCCFRKSFTKRNFSWQGHGTDLLNDSLAPGGSGIGEYAPKIILRGHSRTGFDVVNMIKNMDPSDEDLTKSGGIVHMAGSVIAFPGACFLWKVRNPQDLTIASLAPVILYRPAIEYLFIGSKSPVNPQIIASLKQEMAKLGKAIVVEPMDLVRMFARLAFLHVCACLLARTMWKNLTVFFLDVQTNAMGTFNILNAEDRLVAAALILDPVDDQENPVRKRS